VAAAPIPSLPSSKPTLPTIAAAVLLPSLPLPYLVKANIASYSSGSPSNFFTFTLSSF
jgi:hypothetical protein